MNNAYNISFTVFTRFMLPILIRLNYPKVALLIIAMLEPIRAHHIEFQNWKNDLTYKMQHTCQVIYIEKVLNDIWGTGYDNQSHLETRQIFISNGERPDILYLYTDAEQNPEYLDDADPFYIVTQSEYDAQYADFIVNVPVGINFNENQMKSIIDYYKMAGKMYRIQLV